MKKLFFSALAIVAFSLTSFANEIENKNVVEPVKEVATTELINTAKDDSCFDVTIRWQTAESYYDDEYCMEGVSISVHEIEFTICF
jgi:hypothetical protein